ncbi:hypothetical protein EV2_028107 [Malus domestica]
MNSSSSTMRKVSLPRLQRKTSLKINASIFSRGKHRQLHIELVPSATSNCQRPSSTKIVTMPVASFPWPMRDRLAKHSYVILLIHSRN